MNRMTFLFHTVLFAIVPATAARCAAGEEAPEALTAQQTEFFSEKVLPILKDHCWECHGPEMQESGLRLDSHQGLMAGGGVKGGQVHGATDEFGFKAVEDPVPVHDLHATILKLLGFDHTRLTYRYAGRDFRLTDVHGSVVDSLIA